MMEQPIQLLATKLYTPPPRPSLVERLRLVERLNAGMKGRLTLISAPAGFGKTTLLSEWRRTFANKHYRLAWVSLDERDNDPTRFWAYCIAALEKVQSSIGEHALHLLSSSPPAPLESILITLMNEFTALPDTAWENSSDIALVLDDYHFIEAQTIHQSVTFLLDHLPAHVHLIIATRIDPPLPLARLRVQDYLAELRAGDLRFTLDETLAFLDQCMGLRLSLHDVTQLMSRTEGWIAGLQLAALSLRDSTDISGFIEAFTGGHRYILDYLAEEVLVRQTETIKNFLLQTSILTSLSAALCDAVTEREDSQALLITLEKSNLFLIPLDHERHWYRYHSLFGNFLRSCLQQEQPEQVDMLHQRASNWYAQQGQFVEAIHYALLGAHFEQAAQLIEQIARMTWMHGEAVTLLGWLDQLPRDILYSRPPLSLFYAWSLITLGRGEKAETFLDDAERGLHAMSTDSCEKTEIRTNWSISDILVELMTLRATLARYWGDVPRTIELSDQLLEQVPANNAILRSLITLNLGYAYRIRGDVTHGIQAFTESSTYGQTAQNTYITLLALSNLAHLHMIGGTLRHAFETLKRTIHYASEHGSQRLPIMVMVHVKKGMVLYEWNDLDAASMQLLQSLELAQQTDDARFLVYTYLALARVTQAQGRLEDARHNVALADSIVQASPHLAFLAPRVAAIHVRLELAQGNLAFASQWTMQVPHTTGNQLDYKYEASYLLLTRIFIAQGRAREALELVGRLWQGAEGGGRMNTLVEILVLQAIASVQLSETTKALSYLQRALTLAEPERYCRLFLDEGDTMATLLLVLLETQEIPPFERVSQVYVSKLLAELGKSGSSLASVSNGTSSSVIHEALPQPLSKREVDVLRCLVSGLSNQAIAREMVLEISTVKSHLKHIYHKLDVENRTQAIARVKELHLL